MLQSEMPERLRSTLYSLLSPKRPVCWTFNEEYFLANIDNWADALKPAYEEHKRAISYGVFGTPKYVIDDKLVPDTDSSGVKEWQDKLKEIGA